MLELQFFDHLDPTHHPPDREESMKEIVRRIQAIVIPTGPDPFDPQGLIRKKYRETFAQPTPSEQNDTGEESSSPIS